MGGSADALRVVAGLAILHLVPGVYIAALMLRETRLGPFTLATVGINYACVIVLSTAVKLCGQVVTPWSYLAAAAIASAALAALVQARRGRLARVQRPGRGLWLTVAAGPAIVGYVFLAHPTIPGSPDDFLTPDFLYRLAKLAPTPARANEKHAPIKPFRGVWYVWNEGTDLAPGESLEIETYGGRVRWLVRATRECYVTFKRGDKLLGAYYFPPPFDIKRHPHNYPPNTQLIDLPVPPGTERLTVGLQAADPACRLSILDLTGLPPEEVQARVRKRYAIWDIGDVREQLSLARNLRDHVLPFTYSYDGTIFDGGGYTITHLPLRSYVGMAAFVLLGDRMASFLFVWLVQLWIVFAITCGLARVRGPWQTLCALLPVLAYATLVRPNIEGACLRTTSIVVLLGFAYFLLNRGTPNGRTPNTALLILFAALCCLTKVGLMALPVLLFAHVFSTRAAGRRLFAALGLTAGAVAAAGLAAFAVGQATGVWDAWWRTLLGGSFAGKFSIVLTLLADVPASGEFARLGVRPWAAFLRAVCDYTWWTAIGSCLLPAAVVLKRDRVAGCLLFAGGVVYLICAASDPTLIIPNTYSSHYFTRVAGVANLLAAGGLRCLCLANVRRRWMAVWIAIGALMLPLAKYEHHRQDKALEAHPWHGAMYKAAVIDSLKREAIRDLGRGRIALARNTCHKMMLVDRTYLPTALLLANCDQAEGKWQAAAKQYEQGLARPWELDDAGEFARNALNAAQCYLRLGNRGRAQYWLDKAAATEGFDRMGLQDQAAAIRGALRVTTQDGP